MGLLIVHVLIATGLFVGMYFLLPRQPVLVRQRGRLLLRPPLARLVWDSTGTAAWLMAALYLCGVLVFARLVPAALVVGMVALRGVWILVRRWRARTVVFDRQADAIRIGSGQVARASDALMLTKSGHDDPALELLLSQPGESGRWIIPWVDGTHAHPIGHAIADYLGIPIMGVPEREEFRVRD